jgi:multiple sugar transport system substrate-binding protein
MRRHLSFLLTTMVLILTACGGAPAAPPAAGGEPTTAPAASGTEKVTLRLWSHQNVAFNQANQQIVDKFMAQNPNIEVKYETFPYDQFIQTLQTSMPAGTEADVIEIFGSWACTYARGGRLLDVPQDVMSYNQAAEVFYKAPLDGYYCDGKLYGLPSEYNLEYGAALVNPDLFAKHNVPYPPAWTDIDAMLSDAKKLTEVEGGAMVRAGFQLTGDAIGFIFLSGIIEQGGAYFADDGKHFNFDTPEARNAVQRLADLALKDKVYDPVVFGGENGLPNSFFQGNVGIGYIGPWGAAVGKTDFPDQKFGYVNVPPFFGTEYKFVADSGWGKVVSKNTKFMAAERENALLFNGATGTVPALKELVASPDELLKLAPWVEPTLKVLPAGNYLGDLTDRDQLFYEIIQKNVNDAMQGLVTVDEAVTNIHNEANAMVDAAK